MARGQIFGITKDKLRPVLIVYEYKLIQFMVLGLFVVHSGRKFRGDCSGVQLKQEKMIVTPTSDSCVGKHSVMKLNASGFLFIHKMFRLRKYEEASGVQRFGSRVRVCTKNLGQSQTESSDINFYYLSLEILA